LSDLVRSRSREPEPASGDKYIIAFEDRAKFTRRQFESPLVIRGPKADSDYDLGPQGRTFFYMHPVVCKDTCLQEWEVIIRDVRTVSGKHRHQGGLIIFVLEGHGYTTINGVRHDWQEGDLLLLPMMPEGVEHQHFNSTPGKPARWMAMVYEPIFNGVGTELEQTGLDAEWAAKTGTTTWQGAQVVTELVEPGASS
jgi:hypothetical protein